jgi:predicted nucleotidyltransferase
MSDRDFMKTRINEDLELIKESVLESVQPEAIYLFGSYAYGTPNEDSDIDIYVVVPDETTGLSELYGNIRVLISRKKKFVPIDLQMDYSSVFNRRRNGPTLESAVAKKGMILYGS